LRFFLQFSNRKIKNGHTFYVQFLKMEYRIENKKTLIVTDQTIIL